MFKEEFHGNLEEFFISKIFRIPEYQRPYSWEKKNWEDTYNDIKDVIEEGNGDIDHYWGTITLFNTEKKVKKGGRIFTVYEVIDGQQRIVTIILFLLAISKIIKGKKTQKTIINNYIKSGSNYRVELGIQEDDIFFERLVSGQRCRATRLSQKMLRGALNHFSNKLRNCKQKEIEKIYYSLVNSNILEFVVYDKAMSVRSFQLLNDRGKDITLIDKAKSTLLYYVVKYLPKKEADELLNEVSDQFGKVLYGYSMVKSIGQEKDIGYLEQLSENEFLRLFYHYFGYFANQKFKVKTHDYERGKLFKRDYVYDITAKAVFDLFTKPACEKLKPKIDNIKLKGFVNDYANKFSEWSYGFVKLFRNINRHTDNDKLTKLLRFQQLSAETYPLIINLSVKGVLTDELLRLVEVFDFRIYKVRPGDPIAYLYRDVVANTILENSDEDILWYEGYIRDDLLQWYGNDNGIRRILNSSIYNKPWVRYILWEYNKEISDDFKDLDDKSFFDTRKVQIEHIFARGLFNNVPEEETDEKAREYGFNGYNDYKETINLLGNLVLFEYNPQTSNNSPKEKVKYYQKSKFPAAKALGEEIEEDGFDRDKIIERTENIADFCLKRWSIEPK